jgi:hypothetical protein
MNQFRTILVVSAFAITAVVAMAVPSQAAPKTDTASGRADQISAAQRHYYHRRYVRRYRAPAYRYAQPSYRGGNDPSIAPGGGAYRVPEYLRNQCHIDDGYGRFSACPDR